MGQGKKQRDRSEVKARASAGKGDVRTGIATVVEPRRASSQDAPLLPPVVQQWLRQHGATLGICLFLAIATLIVYGKTLTHPFVSYDDNQYVYENFHVKQGLTADTVEWAFTSSHAANWHPLTTLSHALDWSLYGKWSGGHHLTNVLLHAAGAIVLFLALRQLTGGTWRSGLVAALFCLHPLHVESVAWVSERKDVLSGLFFGLTLWAYASYAQQPFAWNRYVPVVVLFAVGLLCKPMLVTLPLVLLLLDYWPLNRWKSSSPRMLLVEKLPLLALSAASCVATFLVQKSAGALADFVAPWMRLQTVVLGYARYLKMLFWPIDLAVCYPRDRELNLAALVLCGLAITLVSAAVLIWCRQRWRFLLVGWFWFLGMIVPVSGIVPLGDQAVADRYSYLPLTGLFLVLVWAGAELLGRWPRVASTAAGVALAACAALSLHQAGYWSSNKILYQHALEVTKNNYLCHTNYGVVLMEEGKDTEAEEQFNKALQARKDYHLALCSLGSLERKKGHLPAAVADFRAAIESRPDFAPAYAALAAVYEAMGQYADAERESQEALRINPENSQAEAIAAIAIARQGRFADAVPHFRRALEFDPDNAELHLQFGIALFQAATSEAVEEALGECRKAIELKPDDVAARHELAKMYHTLGRLQEAFDAWKEVLMRQRGHLSATKGMGMVLSKSGHGGDAVPYFQQVLAAEPRDMETRQYLAFAYLAAKQPKKGMDEFREMIRLDPANMTAMNTLAWLEATHPDAKVRNGKESIELAQRAAKLKKVWLPNVLDTLAAAYAETGQFKEAVETARKAKKAAEDAKTPLDGLDARIQLYEAGKPYRDPMFAQ